MQLLVSSWRILAVLFCFTAMLMPDGALAAAEPSGERELQTVDADVCVYGGTSGGVVAAVQARRMGKSAVILEPGRHLGGMTSGGLSAVDIGDPRSVGGIAREYFTKLAGTYGRKLAWDRPLQGVPTGGAFSIEPHTAEQLFGEMVRDAKIPVHLQARLATVKKDGARISQLVLADGTRVRAKMFIDATYEGDLMAAAGVSYTVGREGNAKYGEQYNGIHYTSKYKPRWKHDPPRANGRTPSGQGVWDRDLPLDPYVVPGDAKSGLLPLLQEGEPGKQGEPAPGVQAYCFRLCLTTSDDRLPIEPPDDYDPRQYELVARFIAACEKLGDDIDLRWFSKYDPLPNDKYDFNTATFGGNLPGASWQWPEASYERRRELAKLHENYHRGLLHFLATDERVPEKVCRQMKRFGLPRDEFRDTGGWPHQIYVREGRRMVSDVVMTEHHTHGRTIASRPIGLGSYGTDTHEIRRIVKDGVVTREGKTAGGRGGFGPYGIDYGAIVPKQAQCENLLVTFALSASHTAFSSIRMEPVFMINSQSAATAACLAIDASVPVQQVAYEKLRARLIADKQILPSAVATAQGTPPLQPAADDWKPRVRKLVGVVVDDEQAQFRGAWEKSSRQTPLLGEAYRHDKSQDRGQKSARFSVKLPSGGKYEARLLYTPHANRATNAKVVLRSAQGEHSFRVNQRSDPLKDGIPRALGEFNFAADRPAELSVSNDAADGYVIVDGVQFVPVDVAKAEREAARAERAALQGPVRLAKSASPAYVNGKHYDLLVVGGTPGGIACAVRAAREGCTVLLVQHNGHIGGMMTNGLTQWDALYGGQRAPFFSELLANIEHYYREVYGENSQELRAARFSQKHYPLGMVEPQVAEREYNRLVAGEKNITLLLNHFPAAVQREGRLLKSVTLRPRENPASEANDIRVTATTFADATYVGDLAALAKVPYRVGREARDEFDEPHAGKLFTNIAGGPAPKAAVEGRLDIRPYSSKQGAVDPESPFTADGAVQAYNYRFSVTRDPENRILPDKPANYRREEYVHYERKYLGGHVGPRQKSHVNSPILPGENHAYPEADWPTRDKITQRHLEFGLGLMYFLQNDESVPAGKRAEFRKWGLPKDEFADNHHVPYEMYVREARRIVGRHVYTEHDNSLAEGLERTPIHPDSVAITDWYMDSHACTTDSRPKYKYDGKLILTEQSRPGQIPYRSLLPKDIDNLLVPVCLSATHVAWGAVRLEPVWMQTGEAAGFAAALAKKHATTPGKLDPDLLVFTLAQRRMMISFFNHTDVSASNRYIPAVQYFGTKGFFRSYDARPSEPLTATASDVWVAAFGQLAAGEAFDPGDVARKLPADEQQAKEKPVTLQQFAAKVRAELSRRKSSPEPFTKAAARLSLDENAPLARSAACLLLYEALFPHAAEAQQFGKVDLFEAGQGGYELYRIPGIVVTKQGTLLAYCEARKSARGDWGTIDVMLRRSTDGGATWQPRRQLVKIEGDVQQNPVALKQNLARPGEITVNNPVAIADHKTGDVHFLYCVEYARCYYMRSSDDGESFSKPVDITATFEKFRDDYDWQVLATGPGHGIQLRGGRLIVPVWLSTGTGGHAHRPSAVSVIYSDDHGRSWQRGEIVVAHPHPVNPSETVVVELADGRVMLNIRHEGRTADEPRRLRAVAISKDGATGWSQPRYDEALPEPICMGSIARLSAAPQHGKNRILFAHPHNAVDRTRKNLTVKLSYDEGQTWPTARAIEPGPSGYSDLAVGPDGSIYCFYERGQAKNHYQTRYLTLAKFNLAWLTDGQDEFSPTASRLSKAAGALAFAPTLAAQQSNAAGSARPNVVFIAVDDLNDWIGVMHGHPQARTPNFDRLAARGMLFERAYCTAPACNPSRKSVLTGLRPSTSGLYYSGKQIRDVLPDVVTLPEHFKRTGYRTEGGGKIFHTGMEDPQSWHDYFPQPKDPEPRRKPHIGLKGGHPFWRWQPLEQFDDADMADGKLVAWASQFLRRDHKQPFFLGVGFYRPHMPWHVPQKYFDQFPLEKIQLPKIKSGDIDDLPPYAKWLAFQRTGFHANAVAQDQWKPAVQAYLACIAFADAQLGRLIDALDSSRYGRNTVIVLWSDNGMHLGEKQHWTKWGLWEQSTRTPLIVVAPGVCKVGSRCETPVSLLDIYPTLVELCGLPENGDMEGESLVPLLKDPSAGRDAPAITTHGHMNHAVRTARWRYIRYRDGSEELYDHKVDPHEWDNLAGDQQHRETLRQLRRHLPPVNVPDPPYRDRKQYWPRDPSPDDVSDYPSAAKNCELEANCSAGRSGNAPTSDATYQGSE